MLKDVWFTDGDWIVSLGTLDPQAHGTGFSGYELSDDGLSIKRIVQASTFTAEPSHWALQDVRVYTPDTFTQEQEPDFVLPLRQDPETFRLVSTGTKPQQLPLWQLGDAISQLKSSGSNVEALRTAWHAKLAYAASILVMAFVATAIVSWKDNIYIAVTVALLCTFLYFAVYTSVRRLGSAASCTRSSPRGPPTSSRCSLRFGGLSPCCCEGNNSPEPFKDLRGERNVLKKGAPPRFPRPSNLPSSPFKAFSLYRIPLDRFSCGRKMCSLGLTRVLFFERGQREKASFRGRSLNMNPA